LELKFARLMTRPDILSKITAKWVRSSTIFGDESYLSVSQNYIGLGPDFLKL